MSAIYWLFWIAAIVVVVGLVVWYLKSRNKEDNLPMTTNQNKEKDERESINQQHSQF